MNIESSIQKIIFQTFTRSLKVDSNISTFCFDAKFKDLKVYAMFCYNVKYVFDDWRSGLHA